LIKQLKDESARSNGERQQSASLTIAAPQRMKGEARWKKAEKKGSVNVHATAMGFENEGARRSDRGGLAGKREEQNLEARLNELTRDDLTLAQRRVKAKRDSAQKEA